MKSFNCLVTLSLIVCASVFAEQSTKLEQAIHCKGKKITVFGDPQSNTLLMSLPGETISRSLPIVQVIPMFPIYSVTAKKDLRPVDGALTVANLNIRTEGISVSGGGMPATLKVEYTPLHGGVHYVSNYNLVCTIEQ